MILAIDIGNTNITMGAFKDEKCVFVSRLHTDKLKMADQYAYDLICVFSLYGVGKDEFSGCIISNVVPEISSALEEAVLKVTGKTPMIIGPGIKTGINMLVDNPAQVGSDIVAGAVAAVNNYPLPCLVVDLGTASKIIAIDENKSFCGMIIACGVKVSLDALSDNASLLTSVQIKAPKNVIGKNTIDCMQSGVVYGTASMIDGLIDRFEKEMKSPIKSIVATGGYAQRIVPYCNRKIEIDPILLLDGLRIIYNKNK